MKPRLPEKGTSWSLQRRLVIGLALSIGSTFAILFLTLDYWIDRAIYQRMDTSLMQRSAAVGRMLQALGPQALQLLMPEYEPEGHTEFFTVFDQEAGTVALRSPSSAGATLSLGPTQQGTPRYYDVTLPDGHAGRALATRLPMPEGRSKILVVATEREDWNRTERRVHFALLGGIALATLLATGLALYLVRRVVAILERTGVALSSLRADRPMQPLGGDFPHELRPFVDAFNLGLHHLYSAIDRERRFASDVAHELRTPLAEIRTSAESALRDSDPERARRGLRTAIQACSRMQRSVDTLLLVARLESGQQIPAPDPLDLAALVRELLQCSRQQAMQAGRIPPAIRQDLPASAWIQSDQGILERILSNLLRNAMEYAPAGDVLECCLQRGEAGWVLSITNTAPRLQMADLEHLGKRFWRKDPEGGTVEHAGLGIALVFALAQAIALPLRFSLKDQRLTVVLGPWASLV